MKNLVVGQFVPRLYDWCRGHTLYPISMATRPLPLPSIIPTPPFTQWVNGTVGIIEDKGNGRVVVRVASHRYRLPNAMMSWFTVCLTNACCDVLVTMPSRVHNIFVMDQIGFLRKRS